LILLQHYNSSHFQTSKPSVVVSLGIGADIRAEEKLKEVLPKVKIFSLFVYNDAKMATYQVKLSVRSGNDINTLRDQHWSFFGADPVMIPNAELFSKVGKFFPFAITNSVTINRQYRVTVEHINVLGFFLIMLERNFIDHVIMDNEGPEYDFIPMIAINNVFAKNGICICHMNVEVSEGYEKFTKIMWDLLVAGRFGIIHNLSIGHQRMFIVNYEDRRCTEKYLEQFFK
uniref:Methyltransf_21 domain-containing protein n=1 Tax=Angiostrongylus costaricensis TaxID=334426 RepID=A0A0R3PST5_ANGCS